MVQFVEFLAVNRYRQIQGEIQKKNTTENREEQGDAHELLTSSCDDSRARLVRMAVYGIREVRASERVSERASRVVRVSTRGCLFIGQSAQLRAIRIATVAHGWCLICMQMAMSHLHARCMQIDGALSPCPCMQVHANGRCVMSCIHACMHA